MEQLSGLDAAFLTLESDQAPMVIGGVSILDPRTPRGRLEFAGFRELVRRRLPRALAFRRRLAAAPFRLTRPYWVELAPEEIDLDGHLERTQLPAPGGWHELSELVAWELARPLPQDRPLWQMLWVEGVRDLPQAPDGAVAVIGRVHHAAIDGVSGAEILGALFDGEPQRPDPAGEPPAGARREREPRALELLRRAGQDAARAPLALPGVVGRTLLGLAGSAASRLRREEAPPLPFTAPRTPLNHALTARRAWAPAIFELDRLKRIKNRAHATVNDVVLALSAGALRSWLQERGELPEEPLVAMVPVSVRGEQERRRAGNLVSAMLVSLATDEPDPKARLLRIRDAARSSKLAHQAIGARTLIESTELLPFALSGAAVRLYSRLHLAERHRPLFNLVITNVPGPPRPLTVGGARLLAQIGAAPLFDGLGLILPVFSYAGALTIGVTADRRLLPRAALFAEHLRRSLGELEAAVGRAAR